MNYRSVFHYPHDVVTDVPPSMRPPDRLAHQPTLPPYHSALKVPRLERGGVNTEYNGEN